MTFGCPHDGDYADCEFCRLDDANMARSKAYTDRKANRFDAFTKPERDALSDGLLNEADLEDEELAYRVDIAVALLDELGAAAPPPETTT